MNNDEAMVTQLCERLGAAPGQARVMAQQLLKRADQLAAERGITRVEAMSHLLTLVAKGSQGQTPAGFEGGKPPGPSTPAG